MTRSPAAFRFPWRWWGLVLAATASAACGRHGATEGVAPQPSAPPAPTAPPAKGPDDGTVLDVLASLDRCTLGHRGLLFDLGEPVGSARSVRLDGSVTEHVEREGATWARFRTRTVHIPFVALDEARSTEPLYVAARVRGLSARGASVTLDGKPVGSWSFGRDEARVVVARGGPASLTTGSNDLAIHFVGGGSRQSDEVLAEVDWVHVGQGEPDPTFAAPTRAQAVATVTLDGPPRRGLSLRAPGFVRCTSFFPPGSRLELSAGLVGAGGGDIDVRVHRDRTDPVTIAHLHVTAEPPRFTHAEAPLPVLAGEGGAAAGSLATLEIVASQASRASRVVLSDVRVVVPATAPSPPPRPLRGAILVVLGSVAPRWLAPYGGSHGTVGIAEMARRGAVFEGHRASAGFASGAVASMITGLGPRGHGLIDPDARLPKTVTTVADAARQASVATAFFTANPETGRAFGFDRGWDSFFAQSLTESAADGGPAVRVLDELSPWLSVHKEGRFLAVVHARGAHPPWDLTPDELKHAPPAGYVGTIDPRNAGPLLARARKPPLRLSDADRTRLWALHGIALDAHDAALGRLLATVKAAGREDDTAIFVTSDVAASETTSAPYAEGEPVDEGTLGIPLLVVAPGIVPPGRRVATPTSSIDLARSLLAVLGLDAPAPFGGVDVTALARRDEATTPRPLVAEGEGRFIVRWGPFVLVGAGGKDSRLCDLSLEPACLTDVQSTYPIALDALRRAARGAMQAEAAAGPTPQREPATIDTATGAALRLWGR